MARSLVARLGAMSGWRGFLLSFLLGAFAVLGHAPFYLWPVTLLALAGLFLKLEQARQGQNKLRASFGVGFAFGFGYFLFGLYWIGSAFIARGPEFIPFMPLAILGLGAGLALFWALAGVAYTKLSGATTKDKILTRALLFASVFFIAEYARGHILSGFPWNLPGYVFPAGKPISQIAASVGIYGVTALVFYLSAVLAVAAHRRYKPLAVGALVLASIFVYGSVRLGGAKIDYVDGVNLRIVHAKIDQRDKFDPDKYAQIITRYLQLSFSEGVENVSHIIWPEGAVPGLMFEDPELMRVLDQWFRAAPRAAATLPPVFIAQSLRSQTLPGDTKPSYYNAAAAVTFEAGRLPIISPFYDKQKLVPFGEFVPGGAFVQKLGIESLSSALQSMSAGRSGIMPSLPGLPPVSIQICYEIIFPGFTPAKIQSPERVQMDSPKWILNLSNDSWYGNSTGPRQHINQVRYRAIEEGLAVVRATSGGISGLVDPYGRQLSQLNVEEEGVLDIRLPRPGQKNPYNEYINLIALLLNAFMLIGCFVRLKRAH